MAIEIVDFPMKNGGSFHCYVSSPEGNYGLIYRGMFFFRAKPPNIAEIMMD